MQSSEQNTFARPNPPSSVYTVLLIKTFLMDKWLLLLLLLCVCVCVCVRVCMCACACVDVCARMKPRAPVVQNSSRVACDAFDSNRIEYPTVSPMLSQRSAATRSATEIALRRRGCARGRVTMREQ